MPFQLNGQHVLTNAFRCNQVCNKEPIAEHSWNGTRLAKRDTVGVTRFLQD